MIIDHIRREDDSRGSCLRARVRGGSAAVETQELWFRFPARCREDLAVDGTPFLAAALLPSMVGGTRLRIDGPVSPRLMAAATRIQDIYALWVPGARRVAIEADTPPAALPRPGRGEGCFFSGGVDSFYSALKHARTLTDLILIEGFDFKMHQSASVCREIKERSAATAGKMGKNLVLVETNARALFEPVVPWNLHHGAVLAAVGTCLQRRLRSIYVPASYTYRELHPWGSHPLLDPLWSTELTEIIHDGAEASRGRKVMESICRSEVALQTLRVCWSRGDDYNCGRCEKCLRTMIALHIGGGLGRCTVFPQTLPLEAVSRQRFSSTGQLHQAMENVELLESMPGKSPFDHQLQRAIRTAIRRSKERLAGRARSKPLRALLRWIYR